MTVAVLSVKLIATLFLIGLARHALSSTLVKNRETGNFATLVAVAVVFVAIWVVQ